MALGAVVYHTVYPFALTSLLASVHWNNLVYLKVPDFYINTGPSLKLLTDILLLQLSHGDSAAKVLHAQTLHAL